MSAIPATTTPPACQTLMNFDALRREIIAREGPTAVRRYYQFKPVWQRAPWPLRPGRHFLLDPAVRRLPDGAGRAGILPAHRIWFCRARSPPPRRGVPPRRPSGFAAGRQVQLQRPASGGDPARRRRLFISPSSKVCGLVQLTATPRAAGRRHGWTYAGRPDRRQRRASAALPGEGPPLRSDQRPSAAAAGDVEGGAGHQPLLFQPDPARPGVRRPARRPLGIAQVPHAVAQSAEGVKGGPEQRGWHNAGLLELAASLSVMIGFMNLLPIPVLDGGHLLFYAYEAVSRLR